MSPRICSGFLAFTWKFVYAFFQLKNFKFFPVILQQKKKKKARL